MANPVELNLQVGDPVRMATVGKGYRPRFHDAKVVAVGEDGSVFVEPPDFKYPLADLWIREDRVKPYSNPTVNDVLLMQPVRRDGYIHVGDPGEDEFRREFWAELRGDLTQRIWPTFEQLVAVNRQQRLALLRRGQVLGAIFGY